MRYPHRKCDQNHNLTYCSFEIKISLVVIQMCTYIIYYYITNIYSHFDGALFDLVDELENEEPYFQEEFSDDEVIEEVEPKTPRRTTEKSTKRVRVRSTEANQAKELLQQSSTEVVRKRKARRSGHDTVTTKRRKLSDTQPIDSKPRKRRAVKRDVGEVEMDETLKRFVSESPEE